MSDRDGTAAPISRGRTKGLGVANARAWVLENHGLDAWRQVVDDELAEPDRRVVESVIAVEWFPLDTYARLFRAIDRVTGTGDLSVVHTISRYQAEKDLKTVYRLLLRLKSPAYVIEKTGDLWRRYHDTGTFTARREGSCRAVGTLTGWAAADEVLCAHNVVAYVERTLELVGATDVSVQHSKCVQRGDAWCEYRASWS